MAGEVRFGQDHEAGHSAGSGKDVPGRIADRGQLQLGDQPIEERTQERQIRESGGFTATGVHDPLDSAHGTAVYRRPSPALRFSLYPAVMNRREAIAALASAAALPLVSACSEAHRAAGAGADHEAERSRCSIGLPTTSFACRRRARPRSASTPARRAALRSQLADRSPQGQQRLASQVRADLERVNAFDTARLSHATRTSVEVVRSAYATALEGFALPYGDITVGGWRNTPYVVIQNVGAYLDVPRFLDSDHRIENAADAEAYLARLQSYAKQLDGELGPHAGGARRRPRAAGVPDRQGAGADAPVGEECARRRVARRVDRAADEEHSRQLGRARADDRRAGDRAGARAAVRANCRRSGSVATNDAGICGASARRGILPVGAQGLDHHDMSPDEVHEMGQSELQRLHAQMDAILKEIGYSQGTVGERMKALAKDPRYKFSEGDKGRAEIMAFIQNRLDWIRAQMPRAFNTVVNPNMEVKRLPPEEEPGAPGGVRRRRDRSTARSPAASGSTSGPRTCTASTAWPT